MSSEDNSEIETLQDKEANGQNSEGVLPAKNPTIQQDTIEDKSQKIEEKNDPSKDNNTAVSKTASFSQLITQHGDGNPTNNVTVNLLRGEDSEANNIALNFTPTINFEKNREKPVFYELKIENNKIQLDPTLLDYIGHYTNSYLTEFISERILLINNLTGQEYKSLALLESFLENGSYESVPKIYSHSYTNSTFRPLQVIYDLKEIKREMHEEKRSYFLILKSTDSNNIQPDSQLETIMFQTADQNSAMRMLKDNDIYLVIFTNNISWLRDSFKTECKLPYITISVFHEYLWVEHLDIETRKHLLRCTEKAQADYGWLSDKTNDQKISIIKEHLKENRLITILDDYINEKEDIELNYIADLLEDSIKKIILFNSTFFPRVSIIEYEAIINLLITHSSSGEEKETHLNTWKDKADNIIDSCGLILAENESKIEICRFAIETRRDKLFALLLEKYKLFLQINCDTLVQQYLYDSRYMSIEFLDGLLELIFIVRNDKGQYLRKVCLNIVNQIESESEKEAIVQVFFFRLLFIIEKWQSNLKNSENLIDFYQDLLTSRFKQNIFGSILWHLCSPSRSENISYFKFYLDNCKLEQESEKQKIARKVIHNYKGSVTSLFKIFIVWNNSELVRKQLSESFFQVYVAVILFFYENRFGNKFENKLDYQLVHECLTEKNTFLLCRLSLFFFPINGLSIISKILRRNNKEHHFNDAIKDKVQLDWLYYLWAFISIRIVYLHKLIASKDDLATEDKIHSTMLLIINTLKRQGYSLKHYKYGIRDVMEELSNKIGEESERENPNDNTRLTCKNCIKIARQFLEMANKAEYAYTNTNLDLFEVAENKDRIKNQNTNF